MTDLEKRLVDLGDHLDSPTGAGLTEAVLDRLAAPLHPGLHKRRRRWRWLVGGLAVGVGAGVAPAVADWLGVHGIVVSRDPAPTTLVDEGGRVAGPDLGERVALADLPDRAGFSPVLPAVLGPPVEVWFDDRTSPPVVWLRWGDGPLVAQFEGRLADAPVMQKFAPDATVEWVDVGGRRALWVEGSHEVVLHDGGRVRLREADSTLLLEVGALTVRIETSAGRSDAIRIARSFPGT